MNGIVNSIYGTNLLAIIKDNNINIIVQKNEMECRLPMTYANFLKICIIGGHKAAKINAARLLINKEEVECNLAISISTDSVLRIFEVDSKEEILSVKMGSMYKKLIVGIFKEIENSKYNLYIATKKNASSSIIDALLDKSLDIVVAYRSTDVLSLMITKYGLDSVWKIQKVKGM